MCDAPLRVSFPTLVFPPVGFSDRLGSILSHSKVMVELVLSNGDAKLHSHDK